MLIIDNNVFYDIGAKICNRDIEGSHPIEIATRDVEHAADLQILNKLRTAPPGLPGKREMWIPDRISNLCIPRSFGNFRRTLQPFPFCAILDE